MKISEVTEITKLLGELKLAAHVFECTDPKTHVDLVCLDFDAGVYVNFDDLTTIKNKLFELGSYNVYVCGFHDNTGFRICGESG
jgi:hypothetical protein